MHSRKLIRAGFVATLVACAAQAMALEVTQVGASGASTQPGGNASALASSGDPLNRATATGGLGGGNVAGGASGAGGQSLAMADVGGGSASALAAEAIALGGQGGICFFPGLGGAGGGANATSQGASATASSLDVSASATGGRGGNASGMATGVSGGNGGSAFATGIGLLGSTGVLRVNALAHGGDGASGVLLFNAGTVTGGAGGGVSFGEVSGNSSGDAIIRATGIGGNAGSAEARGGFSVAATAGVDVLLDNVVSGTAPGLLRFEQLAQAGNGGSTLGGFGGRGGDATSLLDRAAAGGSGARTLELLSQAIGGSGGSGSFSGPRSGQAEAVARGSNMGGSTSALALATGGGAGGLGNPGGTARAEAMAQAVTTAAAEARATGGVGGDETRFFPPRYDSGAGGAAVAVAGAHTFGTELGTALASASGGRGGNARNEFASPGGNATAEAMGTANAAGPLQITATARAGDGGDMTSAGTVLPDPRGSAGSNATASAAGSTGGSGNFLANAIAGRNGAALGAALPSSTLGVASASVDAIAAAGTLRASAATGTRGLLVTDVTAAANGTFSGQAQAQAQARVTSTAPPAGTADGFTATAFGTGSPLAADVAAFVTGNPNAKSTLGAITTSRALLLGTLGATHTSGSTPQTMTLSLGVSVDLAYLPPADRAELTLALVNPLTGGFQSLALNVSVEGIAVLAATFADPAAATAYFTDHVLDLGPLGAGVTGTLDVQIALTLVTAQPGDSFRAEFLVANGAAVPEPRVWALFAAGVIVATQLRRRR